jgi:phage shock protein A
MRFLSRLVNLLRGGLGQWLGRREQRNPGAVYEAAIQERLDQYAKLRGAAAGVLYLRGKLARELETRSVDLRALQGQLQIAVDRDDDQVALALIVRRDALGGEVERLSAELGELTNEAEAAKRNLVAFHDEIARLREEKVRMLARLANAQARLRLHETLTGLSPEADIQALEAVREHVTRLVAEVQLVREAGDSDLERRLASIRDVETERGARAQLEEMKRTLRQLPAAS